MKNNGTRMNADERGFFRDNFPVENIFFERCFLRWNYE